MTPDKIQLQILATWSIWYSIGMYTRRARIMFCLYRILESNALSVCNRICERLTDVQEQGGKGKQDLEETFRSAVEELKTDSNSVQELGNLLRDGILEMKTDSRSMQELGRLLGERMIELKADT